jgi:hypothetical protein
VPGAGRRRAPSGDEVILLALTARAGGEYAARFF